jgi:hypothetical protein
MFKYFLLFAFLFLINAVNVTADVYVSNNGSDDNPGSRSLPVQTLQKAVLLAGKGETIFLERGSVFRGSVSTSGIHYKAYGDQGLPRPVVSGGIKIDNWEMWEESGPVYRAELPLPIRHLYVNGEMQTIARYPNTVWLKVGDKSTGEILVDPKLMEHPGNTDDYWVGAILRWRKWSWWYESRPVTGYDSSSGSITSTQTADLSTSTREMVGIGAGYYLDGLLSELDSPGEWVYVPGEQMVYWWPPENIDPFTAIVEGTAKANGIITSGHGVLIDGIAFQYQNEIALKVTGRTYISNCSFKRITEKALVVTWGAGGSKLSGSEFSDILQCAVWWNENPENSNNSQITGNSFNRIAFIPGYGGSGIMTDICISLINHNNKMVVDYNRIKDVGYAGIWIRDGKATVKRNVLIHCMATLNDGGAIYALGDNAIIQENIILDTEGDIESSHPWRCLGQGIWPEFVGPPYLNNKVLDNTVIGSGSKGLMLLNRENDEITGNVLVDNLSGGILLGWKSGNYGKLADRNLSFNNNLIVTSFQTDPQWYNVNVYGLSYIDGVDYGQMTGTTIVCRNPNLAVGKRILEEGYSFSPVSIAHFKSLPWGDQNMEVIIEEELGVTIFPFVIINDTKEVSGLILPETEIFYALDGEKVSKVEGIQSFHSRVLLRKSNIRPERNRTLISNADFGTIISNINPPVETKRLRIFPNPADDFLTVEMPAEDMKLQLYSAYGKLIQEYITGKGKFKIDISDLPRGSYFIRAVGQEKVFTEKMIKNEK